MPIISAILILLVIVFFSYRQTIAAYPNGGGSYTVATENLGDGAGLLAAAALMIDYILTAAVGISAGVTALTSAVPRLQPHTLAICLLILAILAIVNLRGVKDTGAAFILPTFLFVGTLLAVIGVGVYRTYLSGGHPMPTGGSAARAAGDGEVSGDVAAAEGVCQRLRGDDGCRGGVERSDGVRGAAGEEGAADADDHYRDSDCAAVWDCVSGEVVPGDGDGAGCEGYQSLLSMLVTAVFGRGWFYYLTMGSRCCWRWR